MIEWRAIAGWEGLYEVSNDGRVRSLPKTQVRFNRGVRQEVHWKGRELKLALKNGYPCVGLKDRRSEVVYVHRVVCRAFHGEGPEGFDVAHNDGSRTNNRSDNLRWASRVENMRDKALHGKQPRGEDIYNAKLTEADVVQIRSSNESNREWARRLNVSTGAIYEVRKFRNWRHVGAASWQ